MVGGGNLEDVLGSLLGGVGDLAVVNDDGVTVGTALSVGPADGLGETGLGVGEEELEKRLLVEIGSWESNDCLNVQCHHR